MHPLNPLCFLVLLLPGCLALVDHYTRYGKGCTSLCIDDGSYHYCYDKEGYYEYCSPRSDYTYKGQRCTEPCTYVKSRNYWSCKIGTDGRWDFCSPVKCADGPQTVERHYTYEAEECIGKCDLVYDGTYYCNTVTGSWNYCSRYPNTVYLTSSTPCRSDHDCDFHGEGYTWCYTDSADNWNYCGIHKTCASNLDIGTEGACLPPEPTKRRGKTKTTLTESPICNATDRGNRKITQWLKTTEKRFIYPQSIQVRHNIEAVIASFNSDISRLSTRQQTLLTAGPRDDPTRVVLELSGVSDRNGVSHYDLRIMKSSMENNQVDDSSDSTVLARILVPQRVTFPVRYVKRAFTLSIQTGAVIALKVVN